LLALTEVFSKLNSSENTIKNLLNDDVQLKPWLTVQKTLLQPYQFEPQFSDLI